MASRDGVNGVCDEYTGADPIDETVDPECPDCGFAKSEHPQRQTAGQEDPEWHPEHTHMPDSPLIDPRMVVQPMIANRQPYVTPEGWMMVRYRLQFFNQDGMIVAEPCMVDGKLQPMPVELVFSIDTGRRTISRPHPLSPAPNGGIHR